MAYDMSVNEMRFPQVTFADAAGNNVPMEDMDLSYASSDESIVKWEHRAMDGTANDNGDMAAVAQGKPGTCTVTVTGTNKSDGTQVNLSQDITVKNADAVSGALNFGDVVEKK